MTIHSLQETFDIAVVHMRAIAMRYWSICKDGGREEAYKNILPSSWVNYYSKMTPQGPLEPCGIVGVLLPRDRYYPEMELVTCRALTSVLSREHDMVLCEMLDIVYNNYSPTTWEQEFKDIAAALYLGFIPLIKISEDTFRYNNWFSTRMGIYRTHSQAVKAAHDTNISIAINAAAHLLDQNTKKLCDFAEDWFKEIKK